MLQTRQTYLKIIDELPTVMTYRVEEQPSETDLFQQEVEHKEANPFLQSYWDV